MKFKKSQSGRSMVEMLGVLAIIGVLSVGGIAGYSLSMRRHRANGVVDYVSKFAATLYGQCQLFIQEGITNGAGGTCNMIPSNSYFTDTDTTQPDIGPLPAGVRAVALTSESFRTYSGSDDPEQVNTAIIRTFFDDNKLCQAVASTVGKECADGSGYDTPGSYYVEISIKYN